jgi:hypothetical protein
VLALIRELGLRKWADVEAYLAEHGMGAGAGDGILLTQLADYLELARAQDKGSLLINDRKFLVLCTLDKIGAYGPNSRKTARQIAIAADRDVSKASSFKHALAELAKMTPPLIMSIRGQAAGYWLTPAGRAYVRFLRPNPSRPKG